MSDLMKDVDYLRFYYTSDDAMKEKDNCKNGAYEQYRTKVQGLFAVPAAL